MKYNKFLRTIIKLLYTETELLNSYIIMDGLVSTDTYENYNYNPKVAYNEILSKAIKEKSNSTQSLDNIVYNTILYKLLEDSNNDPIIAHIVANSIDNYTITDYSFTINYDINKDGVLNEMLLSSIKGKVTKNQNNYALFGKYFDEQVPNNHKYVLFYVHFIKSTK